MSKMASQNTSVLIVYLTVCLGPDQRKHQSSASLAFVRGIHRWPVTSPHKGPVTRKMFPFDDVIMAQRASNTQYRWIHRTKASNAQIASMSWRYHVWLMSVMASWHARKAQCSKSRLNRLLYVVGCGPIARYQWGLRIGRTGLDEDALCRGQRGYANDSYNVRTQQDMTQGGFLWGYHQTFNICSVFYKHTPQNRC